MFPDPSLVPPVLAPYQMSFGGAIFSGIDHAQPYQLQQLTGLDLPPYLSGDAQRALDQGEFAGVDLSGGRDIVLTQVVKGDNVSLDHARQVLGAVMNPAGAVEQPLYVQLPSGLFACMARPRKHNFPLDISMVMAGGGVVSSMWHATDPRWYAQPSKTASVSLPSPPGGATFPLTFPVSFGGGGYSGVAQITNGGPMETRPVLVLTGPLTNPIVTNLSIIGAPAIGFNIVLNAGDTLVIDTDFQGVVLFSAGSTVGAPRRDTLTAGSRWWNLPPGLNQISWLAASAGVGSSLTIKSADAYMVL